MRGILEKGATKLLQPDNPPVVGNASPGFPFRRPDNALALPLPQNKFSSLRDEMVKGKNTNRKSQTDKTANGYFVLERRKP
jgi:hypothetical protein